MEELTLVRDVWRFATTTSGAQSVTMAGENKKPKWSAHNWDTLTSVCSIANQHRSSHSV